MPNCMAASLPGCLQEFANRRTGFAFVDTVSNFSVLIAHGLTRSVAVDPTPAFVISVSRSTSGGED